MGYSPCSSPPLCTDTGHPLNLNAYNGSKASACSSLNTNHSNLRLGHLSSTSEQSKYSTHKLSELSQYSFDFHGKRNDRVSQGPCANRLSHLSQHTLEDISSDFNSLSQYSLPTSASWHSLSQYSSSVSLSSCSRRKDSLTSVSSLASFETVSASRKSCWTKLSSHRGTNRGKMEPDPRQSKSLQDSVNQVFTLYMYMY